MRVDWEKALRLSQKSYYLFCCQELTGINFDVKSAKELQEKIKEEMCQIAADTEPKLPRRKLKKTEEAEYKLPAKPFKQDGSLSAHMQKFLLKHHGEMIDETKAKFYNKEYQVVGNLVLDADAPMLLSNQDDLKKWLQDDLGWIPTLWNYKKDKRGKPERDPKTRQPIKTTPKLQENKKLCPNLENLQGDLVKQVVRWLSLRNRYATLEGWLDNPRLQIDGRLPAGMTGITNTHRATHTVVVNLPKAEEDVTYGKEIRSLFIADKGDVLVGYDAAGLEGRVEAHFTWRYDNGAYAEILLDGDVHSNNTFVFYDQEMVSLKFSPDNFSKDDQKFKPYRSKSKNAKYGLSYGCGYEKLSSILQVSKERAKILYEKFWKSNYSLGKLKENLEKHWEVDGNKKFIVGIDGRKIWTRSKSSLINALFQSTGAIIMDYTCVLMDHWLGGIQLDEQGKPCYYWKGFKIKRLGFMHDELLWSCPAEIADELGKLGVKSIVKAGEYFKLNVELSGDFHVGNSWATVH